MVAPVTKHAVPVVPAVRVPTLYEVFLAVPDPRMERGVRYPLPGLLTLATTALLCGHRSLQAISEFGRERRHLAPSLGFRSEAMPCTGVFHYLFRKLDPSVFGGALRVWWELNHKRPGSGLRLNLDGKSARGSHDGAVPCVHLLSVYSAEAQTAVAQLRVDSKTNEHKAALELLRVLPLEGTLLTGDAAFTQRDLAEAIVRAGGDYLLAVKGNQPALHCALAGAFAAPFPPSGPRNVGSGRSSGLRGP